MHDVFLKKLSSRPKNMGAILYKYSAECYSIFNGIASEMDKIIETEILYTPTTFINRAAKISGACPKSE